MQIIHDMGVQEGKCHTVNGNYEGDNRKEMATVRKERIRDTGYRMG